MLVIIFGLPGTGKSFFAEKLAHHLAWKYINSDRIRSELELRGKYSVSDKYFIYQHMLSKAEQYINQAESVILDATFSKHVYLQSAKEMAIRLNTDFKLIEMVADEAVIKERVSQARKYSEAGFAVYLKLKNEYIQVEEEHLVLDTTSTSIQKLIEQAKIFLKA